MTGQNGGALVVGVGNILLRDEGVGVEVVRRIAVDALSLPAGTSVVDGGTLGLDLLPLISATDRLVLVDAVDLGRSPGTVAVLRGGALDTAFAGHLSAHQVGVSDLLAAARLMDGLPAHVALVAIQPEEIGVGLGLSAAVDAAVPRAIGLVRDELAATGA